MDKDAVLILSSGGARGLALIGVLEALEADGWNITAIGGSSIGALIGGFYAAGKLKDFREWVIQLDRIDVMRYFDVTLSTRGFIRGERIIRELRGIMGNVKIEDLSIRYKALAADIISHDPVWFEKGDLLDAIRASVSIPGVFTPVNYKNGMLVDGAIANPLPMNAFTLRENEQLIAVNLNALFPYFPPSVKELDENERERQANIFQQWRDNTRKLLNTKKSKTDKKPGMYGILFNAFEMMQESYTFELVKTYQPNLLVELSRDSAHTFEFNKGRELIEYGKQQTRKALQNEQH